MIGFFKNKFFSFWERDVPEKITVGDDQTQTSIQIVISSSGDTISACNSGETEVITVSQGFTDPYLVSYLSYHPGPPPLDVTAMKFRQKDVFKKLKRNFSPTNPLIVGRKPKGYQAQRWR